MGDDCTLTGILVGQQVCLAGFNVDAGRFAEARENLKNIARETGSGCFRNSEAVKDIENLDLPTFDQALASNNKQQAREVVTAVLRKLLTGAKQGGGDED